VLHYLPHIAIALIVLGAFVTVWRREGDDPLWRQRWNELPPPERRRLVAAARAGTILASQDEIELAAGYARRDRRRGRPARVIAAFDVPIGVILILGGLVAGVPLFVAFGAFFLALGLFRLIRSYRAAQGLRETISRDRRL
jgi:hypothetical protein